ncbi:MAG: BtpA/SgcQ family protein [Tepidisphaeraceae bacterium]
MNALVPQWAAVGKVVIGMIHLRALPGSPRFDGNLQGVRESALRDADALTQGGVQGLMIENFGDTPFFPGRVPAHVVAAMTAIASEVKLRTPLPLGINVLRNDGQGALAVAHAVGARFIRVNVLCGARVTDQGLLQGIAHELLRDRAILAATDVRIFADVDVKHSAPLAKRPIDEEVSDMLERGMADALIVSGAGTGKPTDAQQLGVVQRAARPAPVFVGSGVTVQSLDDIAPHADGFIVGTALKRDGRAENPVDVARVRELMEAVRRL